MALDIVIPPLTPRQEAEAIKETEYAQRQVDKKEGDRIYLISNRWFRQWCQYTGFTFDTRLKRVTITALQQPGPRPGPIDSSDLLAEPKPEPGREPDLSEEERAAVVTLRDPLFPAAYFEVRQPTWQLFKDWYGVEGPEVYVECMQTGNRLETDLHAWHLKVVLEASEAEHTYRSAVLRVNKTCTVNNLKKRACAALGVDESDYVLLDYYGCEKADMEHKLEDKFYKTLIGANLHNQQAVLLRHKDRMKEIEEEEKEAMAASLPANSPPPVLMATSPAAGGGGGGFLATSPPPSSPLARSHSKPPSWAEDIVQTSASRRRGLAGLGNLGNTCFMNSSLQCLAHTVPLMETFLSGRFKSDINTDNPLGQGGKLANAFGLLMEKLWQGGVSSVSPKRFKWQLARFAPQFQGYAQQDSQELLAFLLDGLHEDLNRIQNKPYVEEKDDDGRPDPDLAQEAWANYRARNDSVIVDNFQGLYKSTLVCPRCKHKSRKFDPFMYLSLPLPTTKTRAFSIIVVQVDGSEPPMQYSVEVPKAATMKQLCRALGKVCGVEAPAPAEQVLLLGQQSSSSFSPRTELFTDLEARVSSIKEPSRFSGFSSSFSSGRPTLLLAYRYPDPASGPLSGGRQVVVVHKSKSHAIAPAMPLFLSPEELATLKLEAVKAGTFSFNSQEWVVARGGALDAAIRRLLRPFRRHPEPEGDQIPAVPAEPAAEEPMAEEGQPGSAAAAGGHEILPAADLDAAAAAAAAAAAGDGVPDAMDLEQPDTPPERNLGDATPSVGSSNRSSDDMVTDVPPPFSTTKQQQQEQQEEQGTGAAADAAGGSGDQPFNMWAAQEAAAGTAAAQQAQQREPVREPYRLKLAEGPEGRVASVQDAESPPDLAAAGEEPPLYFLAEWSSEGQQELDPAVLEKPERHQSALDAEAALAASGSKKVTLQECMETFLQPEQLDAEDSWYCSKCKEHVQADKKLDLWSLPEVLVVHLKRFSYSRYSRDKLDTLVEFPLEGLDLARYLLQPQQAQQGQQGEREQQGQGSCVYDLYAVSNHYGGLGGGHYTAFCKMPDDGKWYLFDDSSVRQDASVVSTAAYVLFYRRQGSKVDLGSLFGQQQQQHGELDPSHVSEAAEAGEEPEMQFSVGSL